MQEQRFLCGGRAICGATVAKELLAGCCGAVPAHYISALRCGLQAHDARTPGPLFQHWRRAAVGKNLATCTTPAADAVSFLVFADATQAEKSERSQALADIAWEQVISRWL